MIRRIFIKKGWLIVALFYTVPAVAQSIYIGSLVMMPSGHAPLFLYYTTGPQTGASPRPGIVVSGSLPLIRYRGASVAGIAGASRSGFYLIGDDRRLKVAESAVFAGAETRLRVNRRFGFVGGCVWDGVKVKTVLELTPVGDRVVMRVFRRYPIRRYIGIDYQLSERWRVQATYSQRRQLGTYLADGQGFSLMAGFIL